MWLDRQNRIDSGSITTLVTVLKYICTQYLKFKKKYKSTKYCTKDPVTDLMLFIKLSTE
jgi:hypothetical protein